MSDRAWLVEEPPRVWRERENDGLFIEIPGHPADRVWSTADEAEVDLPLGAVELVPATELNAARARLAALEKVAEAAHSLFWCTKNSADSRVFVAANCLGAAFDAVPAAETKEDT